MPKGVRTVRRGGHAIPERVNGPYSTERPDPPVEGGRPRFGDGTLLCSTQLPGAPDPLAADDLIGINSNHHANDSVCQDMGCMPSSSPCINSYAASKSSCRVSRTVTCWLR